MKINLIKELKTNRRGLFAGALAGLGTTVYLKMKGYPIESLVETGQGLLGRNLSAGDVASAATTQVGITLIVFGALFGYLINKHFFK